MRLHDERLLEKAPRWLEVPSGLFIGAFGLMMGYVFALWLLMPKAKA